MAFSNQQLAGEKRQLLARYNSARINLIFVVILTAVNIIMVLTGSDSYFVFSASIPYLMALLGAFYTGRLPENYYEGGYEAYEFLAPSVFGVLVTIAFVIVAVYLVLYLLSSKGRVGWLIAAEVLFALDTLAMFAYYGFDMTMIVDILLHVYVIVSLAMGISASFKLKKLEAATPAPTPTLDESGVSVPEGEGNSTLVDSVPLRVADQTVKHRVFLSTTAYGHEIVYRRVKKTNELVIDGRVYAEYIALVERPHLLTACLDGHEFGAGLDATSSNYIVVDDSTVASKIRWI